MTCRVGRQELLRGSRPDKAVRIIMARGRQGIVQEAVMDHSLKVLLQGVPWLEQLRGLPPYCVPGLLGWWAPLGVTPAAFTVGALREAGTQPQGPHPQDSTPYILQQGSESAILAPGIWTVLGTCSNDGKLWTT